MALNLLPKPKPPGLDPTVPVGQPMPPMQRIPEPVDMVGRYTGMVHGALGDGVEPETVHVVANHPSGAVAGNATGEVSYASGGIFSVGPSLWPRTPYDPGYAGGPAGDPWGGDTGSGGGSQPGMWNQDPYASNTYNNSTSGGNPWDRGGGWLGTRPGGMPTYTPSSNYPGDPIGAQWQARNASLAARYGALGARGLQLGARQGSLNANLGVLGANRNVLGAQAGVFPYETAARNARAGVINLQALRNRSQRGVVQQAGQNEQERLAELQAIYRASQNVPDILAAGEAENAYNAENRRDTALGVAAPATVTLPPGAQSSTPGVRGQIQTQEQALTRRAGYLDPMRNAQLAIAQNAVQMQDTDVQAAQLEAQRAGLSLEEANQLVQEAQNQAGYAQNAAGYAQNAEQAAGLGVSQADLGVTQAGLAEDLAQTPPAPGLVTWTDPDTGVSQWVTPGEHAMLQAQYTYGPYGTYVQKLEQGLTARQAGRAVAPYTEAQIGQGLRNGVITDEQARAFLRQMYPAMPDEDIDRKIAILKTTGGGAGGYAPIP